MAEAGADELARLFNVDEATKHIKTVFPNVQKIYVEKSLEKLVYGYTYDVACGIVTNHLVDNQDYPREETKKMPVDTVEEVPEKNDDNNNTTEEDEDAMPDADYLNQAEAVLSNDFRRVSITSIREVCRHFNWKYTRSRKFLIEALETNGIQLRLLSPPPSQQNLGLLSSCMFSPAVTDVQHKIEDDLPMQLKLLKTGRHHKPLKGKILHPELKKELEKLQSLNGDTVAAKGDEALDMECGICCMEVPFNKMVQCAEGHLFCSECVVSYTREKVFGGGNLSLACMADGCDCTFPRSEIRRVMPQDILKRYDDREKEEALNQAEIDGLVRCPAPDCDYAAILPEGDMVLRCEKCLLASCKLCKKNWEGEHFGKKCKEVEDDEETKLRTEYEEKMTQAKLRICWSCKTSFMKSDGCNKMTCRCGAKMCYICRKAKIDYNHFCGHLREPGHGCDKCTACSLWSDPQEDDERAVAEIRKEGNKKRRELGFDDEKALGASPEHIVKKKVQNPEQPVMAQGDRGREAGPADPRAPVHGHNRNNPGGPVVRPLLPIFDAAPHHQNIVQRGNFHNAALRHHHNPHHHRNRNNNRRHHVNQPGWHELRQAQNQRMPNQAVNGWRPYQPMQFGVHQQAPNPRLLYGVLDQQMRQNGAQQRPRY